MLYNGILNMMDVTMWHVPALLAALEGKEWGCAGGCYSEMAFGATMLWASMDPLSSAAGSAGQDMLMPRSGTKTGGLQEEHAHILLKHQYSTFAADAGIILTFP
jgi:hypothetical protein